MSQNENLKKISKGVSSKWRQGAEYRNKNRWLIYSSKIARRVLAAIDGSPELNQAKLAALLNVSPQHISKIVKGKENLTLETIYNLSQALSVELISFPTYKWNETKNIEITVESSSMTVILVISITMNITPLFFTNNISYDLFGGSSAHYVLNQIDNSYLEVL
ncbi:MAG TPA: helix-turn-helix transcriptional regulator [Chitinophagaceae bacterium]|nr:helix-turn-helix transcriptional regulator [Chitinophagaceae bacterium]